VSTILAESKLVGSTAERIIFNLPDYRVISTTVTAGGDRQVIVETDLPPAVQAAASSLRAGRNVASSGRA
jgi:hypothetical protein